MLYFVRHGSTDWNDNRNELGQKDPKCQGRVDLPLNANGIKQAELTSIELKDVKFSKVFCSPLKRAKQTCDIIYHGDVPVEIDQRLIERDFGEFEGMTRAGFDFNGFWNVNSNQNFVKAESIKDVEKRIFAFLDEIKKFKNKDILVVAHGGVGCVLMSYFKGVPKNGDYLSFELPHGKPLVVDFAKAVNEKNK